VGFGGLREGCVGGEVEEAVELGFAAVAFAIELDDFGGDERDLELGFEDVLLGGFAGGVAGFGDQEERFEDFAIALEDVAGGPVVLELEEGLFDAGEDIELDGFVLGELGVGFLAGDGGAEALFAGVGNLLGDGEAEAGGRVGAEAGAGQGIAVAVPAGREDRVGEAGDLGRTLTRGFVFLLRHQNLGIAFESLGDEIV
jgi:hypothetical protein